MDIKKILGFCFLMVFVSCSKELCGCWQPTNIDVALSYEDQAGNDLLDPEDENALNRYSLDVFYQKEGSYEEELNYNDSFKIVERKDENNFVQFEFSSDPFENGHASILIDFPDSPDDTLEIQAEGGGDPLYATKMWYNGELIWSQDDGVDDTGLYFEMVKTVNPN